MKTLNFVLGLGIVLSLPTMFAAEKEKSGTATAKEIAFIKKAADGGMAEVELGRVAAKNAQRDDVKQFGKQMVSDHGKANENLKSVASKLTVTVPEKVSTKHQGLIDRMSKLSGPGFDARYIKEMVADHEEDIAEFEKARGEVTNEDLKKFIDETIPVMKEHLEMAKKMKETK
jgi:putative membrane protein